MPQLSFSHQFSNRWLDTPQAVKNAIVQELDDIVQLLDEETDLDSFEFTTPDLHEYVDTIYSHLAEDKAEEDAFRMAEHRMREPQEATRQIDDSQIDHSQIDSNQVEDNLVDDSLVEDSQIDDNIVNRVDVTSNHQNPSTQAAHPESLVVEIKPAIAKVVEQGTTSSYTDSEAVFAKVKPVDKVLNEAFINELENRVDDYLLEQFAVMSTDLKAWLREEVEKKTNPK